MSKKKASSPLNDFLTKASKLNESPEVIQQTILNIFFLKFANDKFEERKTKFIEEGQEKHSNRPEFYRSENVFFVPHEASWSQIINNSKDINLKVALDKAIESLRNQNSQNLKSAFIKNFFTNSGLNENNIKSLLDSIDKIDTAKEENLFEIIHQSFFLKLKNESKNKKFGTKYWTPNSVGRLIAYLVEPYKGRVYDPCCGSGGMLTQAYKFIKEFQISPEEISLYGQDSAPHMYRLAKINFAIKGIDVDLGECTDTFNNDQHTNLKADYIMANLPFNQENWRDEDSLKDDPRWYGYEVPPASNANYAWVLHMVHKLSQNGVAGFLLANGALSSEGKEYEIRKQLVKNDLIEAILLLPRKMFFNTDISVSLWILNRNKQSRKINIKEKIREFRDRSNEILFMDLRSLGSPFEKKYIEFTKNDIDLISKTYHSWKSINSKEEYQNQEGFCQSVSLKEIEEKDFTLFPGKYIAFKEIKEQINWKEKFNNVQKELMTLFKQEEQLKKEVKEILKNFQF